MNYGNLQKKFYEETAQFKAWEDSDRFKMLFISKQYPTETGWAGIATYTYNMAHGLEKLDENIDITILTTSQEEDKVYYDNEIKVICKKITNSPSNTRNAIDWQFKVANFLRTNGEKFELIESGVFGGEQFLANLIKKLNYAIRIHTPTKIVKMTEKKKSFLENQKTKITDFMEKEVIKKAKIITAPSYAAAELEGIMWDIPFGKIKVIPNPLLVPLEVSDKNPLYKNSAEKFNYLLFYGAMVNRKGVYTLLKALPLIFNENKDVKMIFIGKDPYNFKETAIKYLSKYSNYTERVLFIDYIESREELMKCVQDAMAVVLPSLFESFGYVVLESMAVGSAVISTKAGGIKEIITHEKDGILVDTDDYKQLAEWTNYLIENKGLVNNIRRNAVETAKSYSAEKIAKKYFGHIINIRRN